MLADPASVSGLCMHVRHPHLELPALAGLHCSVFGRRQTQQHTSVGDRGLQPGLAQHPAGTERSHCATTKDTYPVGYTDTRMVRDDTTHQLSLGDAGDGDGFGFLLERGCYQYIAFQVKKNYVKRRKREREKQHQLGLGSDECQALLPPSKGSKTQGSLDRQIIWHFFKHCC